MERAPISQLKARLSQYLDAVRSGEDVIVTDRGRPVARLSQVRGDVGERSRMEELVRTGRVRPPRTVRSPRQAARLVRQKSRIRPTDSAGRSLASLLRDRERGL
ncbi:MAG: type II toxin-antitoxin system Phd/YefM family antitoxin [Gemmatimonadota bacterium]